MFYEGGAKKATNGSFPAMKGGKRRSPTVWCRRFFVMPLWLEARRPNENKRVQRTYIIAPHSSVYAAEGRDFISDLRIANVSSDKVSFGSSHLTAT